MTKFFVTFNKLGVSHKIACNNLRCAMNFAGRKAIESGVSDIAIIAE